MSSDQSSSSSPFLRRSPAVQALQKCCPHRDYLTGSKFWNEINVTVSRSHPENPGLSQSPQRRQPSFIPSKPSQWTGNGHGAKHRNDESPFNLWDPETRSYRTPTEKEVEWIAQRYQATKLTFVDGLLYVITNSPPTPVSNTVGGQPTLLLTPEVELPYPTGGTNYLNPRLPDPYSGQKWSIMDTPTMAQMIAVKEALDRIMNVRQIIFFQAFNVVELVVGDGRNYARASLPGRVAGIATWYYHQETTFPDNMRDLTRARFINPQPQGSSVTQDTTNYLNPLYRVRPGEAPVLTPGMRVSTTTMTNAQTGRSGYKSSTLGVCIQKQGQPQGDHYMTVSDHSFRISMQENSHNISKYDGKVWHPDDSTARNGQVVGNVVQTYPELDLSVIKLKPNVQCTNSIYFMAERPMKFLKFDEVKFGDYFEIDGMTSGCMTVMMHAKSITTTPGSREYLFDNYSLSMGVSNAIMAEGMCGAPIVRVPDCDGEGGGGVLGFFHLGHDDNTLVATKSIDSLINDGWEVV